MVDKESQVKDVRATNSSFFLSHLATNTKNIEYMYERKRNIKPVSIEIFRETESLFI